MKKPYKFSIAFENAWYPGYTSEKIVTSMLAGTIPIYWGNPDISREFNSASFINCHDFPTLDDAAAYVKKWTKTTTCGVKSCRAPGKPRNRKPAFWKRRKGKRSSFTKYSTNLRKKRAAKVTEHGYPTTSAF